MRFTCKYISNNYTSDGRSDNLKSCIQDLTELEVQSISIQIKYTLKCKISDYIILLYRGCINVCIALI